MERTKLNENDIEVAPPSVVRAAGANFAAALAETPQFKAFEQAYIVLSNDSAAQQVLSTYQSKAESLRALLMLNAVPESERVELEQLKNEYLACTTVQAYSIAEAELTALCRQTAKIISEAIGINYAAACGASCCG